MAPWPVFGIGLCHYGGLLDRPDEAILLFGGITVFPALIGAVLGVDSEAFYNGLILGVWFLALLGPAAFVAFRRPQRWVILLVLGLQLAFSIAQAGMGLLLLIGKGC